MLFDSPPALELSDPVLLSEHLDGLLFLVGMQQINRSLPVLALRRISAAGTDVLGLLANQVVAPSQQHDGYGYGYSHGYGYSRYLASDDPEAASAAKGSAGTAGGRRLPPSLQRLLLRAA